MVDPLEREVEAGAERVGHEPHEHEEGEPGVLPRALAAKDRAQRRERKEENASERCKAEDALLGEDPEKIVVRLDPVGGDV